MADYVPFDINHVLSLDWWLHHLASAYRDNPFHMLTELGLIVLCLWLILKRDTRRTPSDTDRLSEREQASLIKEWRPEPLVPVALRDHCTALKAAHGSVHITSGTSAVVRATDGDDDGDGEREYINLSSPNYLGMALDKRVLSACQSTIEKYAVGSCGPRGFYGTMDIHLMLERALGEYFGNEAIIYADYIGCPASVITAFAKRGDLLLMDDACHYLMTQGALLSRSNVIWFAHNNMEALESALQTVNEQCAQSNAAVTRRFIITEGVFHNTGDICRLPQLVELKERYKYRLIMDDSHGLGTIHAKGTPGFFNVRHDKVDMYFAGMDKALASTGGFCLGNKEITHHQTLSGAGYVFSASAPPFSCVAVQTVLGLLAQHGKQYCQEVMDNATRMRKLLRDEEGTPSRWHTGVDGNLISPLIHLRVNEKLFSDETAQQYLDSVAAETRRQGVLVFTAVYLPQEFGIRDKSDPKPSLRICVTREHSPEQIQKAGKIIKDLLVKTVVQQKTALQLRGNDEEKQEEN